MSRVCVSVPPLTGTKIPRGGLSLKSFTFIFMQASSRRDTARVAADADTGPAADAAKGVLAPWRADGMQASEESLIMVTSGLGNPARASGAVEGLRQAGLTVLRAPRADTLPQPQPPVDAPGTPPAALLSLCRLRAATTVRGRLIDAVWALQQQSAEMGTCAENPDAGWFADRTSRAAWLDQLG